MTLRAKVFRSDLAFHKWATHNPDGWVLNVRRRMSPDYVVLHRSDCPTLGALRYANGALTERSYRKVGSDSERELLDWVRTHVPNAPTFSKRCTRCRT